MTKEQIINRAFMKCAVSFSELSKAERKKVGAALVKNSAVISIGYNGTYPGFDNACEDENNVTKKEVLHAELNCLSKIAKSTMSSDGADMYITLSPCFDCAKLMAQCGIKRVFYLEEYRDLAGVEFLKKVGIHVEQVML